MGVEPLGLLALVLFDYRDLVLLLEPVEAGTLVDEVTATVCRGHFGVVVDVQVKPLTAMAAGFV